MLLDTHVFLWIVLDDPRLGPTARELLRRSPTRYVSAASWWEIANKSALGRLSVPLDLDRLVGASGLEDMNITPADARAIGSVSLPHRDPFDRLLVAQAMVRRCALLTADAVLLGAELDLEVIDARA